MYYRTIFAPIYTLNKHEREPWREGEENPEDTGGDKRLTN